jgi:hypothetical protein
MGVPGGQESLSCTSMTMHKQWKSWLVLCNGIGWKQLAATPGFMSSDLISFTYRVMANGLVQVVLQSPCKSLQSIETSRLGKVGKDQEMDHCAFVCTWAQTSVLPTSICHSLPLYADVKSPGTPLCICCEQARNTA